MTEAFKMAGQFLGLLDDHQRRLPTPAVVFQGPLRKIMRVEKKANKLAYYEVLTCGHRGHICEGPQRLYIAQRGMPSQRRCKECAANGSH